MDALNKDVQTRAEVTYEQRATIRYRAKRFLLNRHFALLWTGSTVSAFGSYITGMGLPIAAQLLFHATPLQMGLLAALGALPGLVLGLLIGVWVDRLPRRPIMLLADLGRAGLLALIPLLALLGQLRLAWLDVITVLVGLLTVSFEVASLSFLPTVLASSDLALGNSRLGTSESLAEVAGPPMAGLLIQLLTTPVAILLDMLSFLLSALCIGLMRVPEHPHTTSTEHLHVWHEMRKGLSAVWRNPLLRATAAYICTHNFFGGAYAALYLIYTFQLFGASPVAFSVLVALGGIGALGGSFCAGYCARRFGYGRTLVGSALFFGSLSFCTPLAMGPLPLVFALMALAQLVGDSSFAVYAINEISLRQELVPAHLLGRVNACMYILANGMMPLGALLAGLLSEVIGIRWTLLIGSSGIFLATGWLVFSPLCRYK
ncbi:MAG: MFS transporter [Ktedonobacteraceae bacterium]